jgi:hypothetical protein
MSSALLINASLAVIVLIMVLAIKVWAIHHHRRDAIEHYRRVNLSPAPEKQATAPYTAELEQSASGDTRRPRSSRRRRQPRAAA